jgi:hypothetical protein
MKILPLFAIALLILTAGCDYFQSGNLPGVAVDIPVYPGAQIGPSVKKVVQSVPSQDKYKVVTVTIHTDESSHALLEFYKHRLSGVRIEDLGGYYSAAFVPEGWSLPDRIEVQIPKQADETAPGYEIVQFRKKRKGWL